MSTQARVDIARHQDSVKLSTAQPSTAQRSTAQHTAQHSPVQHSTAQHSPAQRTSSERSILSLRSASSCCWWETALSDSPCSLLRLDSSSACMLLACAVRVTTCCFCWNSCCCNPSSSEVSCTPAARLVFALIGFDIVRLYIYSYIYTIVLCYVSCV